MSASSAEPSQVCHAVAQCLGAGNFLICEGSTWQIRYEPPHEMAWELYLGHPLDSRLARTSETFESWSVEVDGARLITILWQAEEQRVLVTRHIETHAYEAYEDPPGVILSRPVQKWTTELVGQVELVRHELPLHEELGRLVMLAVIGTSRLPITSLESPLPAFSLGKLAYLPSMPPAEVPWRDPLAFWQRAVEGTRPIGELAKALEAVLRVDPAASAENPSGDESPSDSSWVARAARALDFSWPGQSILAERLVREVFNTAALSPYSSFGERLLALVLKLAGGPDRGPAWAVDQLGYMLRQLCRHLTAYDLTLFHSLGANYPDALLLDLLLEAYLQLTAQNPDLLLAAAGDRTPTMEVKRRRRRALRQAVLVRASYEGHRVPDAPTSPGENARVLPMPSTRVPEEQIQEPRRRRRVLYEQRATSEMLEESSRMALAESCSDLTQDAELAELGTGIYLDRPLGVLKQPGEVDRTPLISYVAFSRVIASRRLGQLQRLGWLPAEARDRLAQHLAELIIGGLPLAEVETVPRAGVVSLLDAARAAPDFIILRSTRTSLAEFLAHYRIDELARELPEAAAWLTPDSCGLIVPYVRSAGAVASRALRVYDRQCRLRLELGFDSVGGRGSVQYVERGGVELIERLRVEIGGAPAAETAWLRAR